MKWHISISYMSASIFIYISIGLHAVSHTSVCNHRVQDFKNVHVIRCELYIVHELLFSELISKIISTLFRLLTLPYSFLFEKHAAEIFFTSCRFRRSPKYGYSRVALSYHQREKYFTERLQLFNFSMHFCFSWREDCKPGLLHLQKKLLNGWRLDFSNVIY